MATYTPHTYVAFGGVLNTSADTPEIWQCGVRVRSAGVGGPLDDHQAYLDAIAPGLSTWFTTTGRTAFPATATLKWVKANAIDSSGHYRDPTTHLHDYPTAVLGAGTASMPDIMSVAISWVTGKAIRRHVYASHGRIYPPSYGLAPTTGQMRLNGGDNALWAARGTALLHVLAPTAVPCIPIVASGHNAEWEPITGVRVGDVLDVQRRRKSAVREVYSSLPFTLP